MNPLPPRVLLVEDSADDVYFLKRSSEKLKISWELEVAPDGEAAVERLARLPRPTHVLLDLKLPKRSGLEVLAWIRAHSPDAPIRVIVLTSSNEKADQDQARLLGVDDYIVKPVDLSNLRDALKGIARTWDIPYREKPHSVQTDASGASPGP